jgi:histidyl-tRNA synthetase
VTDRLGAQGTVLGGGRYDGLIEALGGPHTPAVGWAAGIERLAMLVGDRSETRPDVIVVAEHIEQEAPALRLVTLLRRAGHAAEIVATGSARKRFDRAKKLNPAVLVSLDVREGLPTRSLRLLEAGFAQTEGISAIYETFLQEQQ